MPVLLAVIVVSMLPATAHAAAPYKAGVASGCTGYNGGGRDAAHRLYMPCTGGTIKIVEPDGSARTVTISHGVARVAPSPDGTYLYSIDGVGISRFTRTAAGNYVKQPFAYELPAGWAARSWRVCGWGIATDGYGNVYASNGGWCEGNPNQILKYSASGQLLAQFGEYGAASHWVTGADGISRLASNEPGSVPGRFQPNMMLAVTADGARVWVADQNNQRVQFFDRTLDGKYAFAGMWDGDGTAWNDQLGAVYGIALDPWGFVYVAQTTTRQVWRLDPDGTNPVLVHSKVGTGFARDHTLAVDGRRGVWVGEWSQRFETNEALPGPIPALGPEPRPDLEAPVLVAVDAPAETHDHQVEVAVRATDDVAVTGMRIADGSGNWQPWQTYSPRMLVQLAEGYGQRVTYVQVRDGMGRDSNVKLAIVRVAPVPDVTAPVVSISTAPATVATVAALTVTSSDNVAVTHLRIAGDDGSFSPWQPWNSGRALLMTSLGSGYGTFSRTIQVRDAAWNVSASATVAIVRVAPPAPVAPVAPDVPRPAQPAAPGEASPVVAGGGAAPIARDRVRPRLRRVLVPRRSCGRRIVIRIAALDNRRVTHVRVANEDGRYGKWKRYRARNVHFLSRGPGYKQVTIQVRDGAGNVSRSMGRRTVVAGCRR
jgi:DNA-binding beta-propeller fold protein YncE